MANKILLLSFVLIIPCFVDSVYFNFTSFRRGDPENVIYHRDARPHGAVKLSNDYETAPLAGLLTLIKCLSGILKQVLPPQVTVGFSAAIGAVTKGHRLLSWEFSSSLDIEKASIRRGLIVGISVSGFVFVTSLVRF